MKLAIVLAACVTAGCASHGSWLDTVGNRPSPPAIMSDEQASAIGAEIMRLRAEAAPLRAALAIESDRLRRIELYLGLRRLGDRTRPLERSLEQAGRPIGAAQAAS